MCRWRSTPSIKPPCSYCPWYGTRCFAMALVDVVLPRLNACQAMLAQCLLNAYIPCQILCKLSGVNVANLVLR